MGLGWVGISLIWPFALDFQLRYGDDPMKRLAIPKEKSNHLLII